MADTLDTSNRELAPSRRDKPFGPPLCHDPLVRNYCPEEEDLPVDYVDPSVISGRGPTKPEPEHNRYEGRKEVSQAIGEVKFELDIANKTIAALLREQYKGDTKWEHVSRKTRDILWQGFGIRFRWDSTKDKEIVQLWRKVNCSCFGSMIACAKRTWKVHKKRQKWCSVTRFYGLVHYWEKPEVQEDALRHSQNRGVVRNEEGQVEKRTAVTFTGGSTSMLHRDKKLAGNLSRTNVFTIVNFKATHMTGLGKKGKKCKSQKGVDGVSCSSQVDSKSAISKAPKWISLEFEKIHN